MKSLASLLADADAAPGSYSVVSMGQAFNFGEIGKCGTREHRRLCVHQEIPLS